MAFFEKHLFVAPSLLPNAGQGLFTKVEIPEGTRIVEYKGRRTTWKKSLVQSFKKYNAYLLKINADFVIDAGRTLSALARYANDAKGLSRVEGLQNNSRYIADGEKAYILSTCFIPAGSEIFVGYSDDYWWGFEENLKYSEKMNEQ